MRLDLPADLTPVHETCFPIRWGDMDILGHVNNAAYFTYLETARVAWFSDIGCLPDPLGTGPVMINAFCNFINELSYPGEVVARQYLGAIGRSSFDVYATLERADGSGTVCANGGSRVVWSDFILRKSVPIPDRIRAILLGYKAEAGIFTGTTA